MQKYLARRFTQQILYSPPDLSDNLGGLSLQDNLRHHGSVVDFDIVDQAGEETAGLKSLSSADI